MKSLEIAIGTEPADSGSGVKSRASPGTIRSPQHGGQFIAARDSRNRRVPGLYIRNGRYYAVLWSDRGDGRKITRRFPLYKEGRAPIRNLTEAKAALIELRQNNQRHGLPPPGRKPRFDVFSAEYLEMALTLAKRPRTLQKEKASIELWRGHLGDAPVDRITTPILKSFVEKRLRGCRINRKEFDPCSPRTVTLDLIALRNILKAAIDAGYIHELPRFPKIKTPPPPRRALLTPEDFQRLLHSCFAKKPNGDPLTKNGQQLSDFLRLLAFSGMREQEALHLRWSHVNFEKGQLFVGVDESFIAKGATIGTGGEAKNRHSRMVDLNNQLESILREMQARRPPDSKWVFPSPQRGAHDRRAKTFRESLRAIRDYAGLPSFGFHDLRHFFASSCLMSGIDIMTIAEWLGHRDGGVLIGKVYGHLLDRHRQNAAKQVNFQLLS